VDLGKKIRTGLKKLTKDMITDRNPNLGFTTVDSIHEIKATKANSLSNHL